MSNSNQREPAVRLSEEFRQNALDCIRLARDAADAHDKIRLLDSAQRWERFAENARMLPAVDDAAAWSNIPMPYDGSINDKPSW
jgi:hypothetical protein